MPELLEAEECELPAQGLPDDFAAVLAGSLTLPVQGSLQAMVETDSQGAFHVLHGSALPGKVRAGKIIAYEFPCRPQRRRARSRKDGSLLDTLPVTILSKPGMKLDFR